VFLSLNLFVILPAGRVTLASRLARLARRNGRFAKNPVPLLSKIDSEL